MVCSYWRPETESIPTDVNIPDDEYAHNPINPITGALLAEVREINYNDNYINEIYSNIPGLVLGLGLELG